MRDINSISHLILYTMALQRRFWNWKDDDLTFDLARAFIGLIDHGLYRGFDPVLGGTLLLKLNHALTGATRVSKDLIESDKYGVVVTKQGVFIQEELQPEFEISPTSDTGRKDIVVLNHNYEDIVGGTEALYSVIEGTADLFPDLPDPNKQEIIGYLQLPPACTALNQFGVIYTRAKQPNFANHVDFIQMSGGAFLTALNASGNFIINLANPVNDQDAATKFYVDAAIANNVVWSSETVRGIIQLATTAEAIAGTDGLKAITPRTLFETILAYTASQAEANADIVDNKFITPKTLGNRTATETRKGVIRIATEVEAAAGTDNETAITPFTLLKSLPLVPFVLDIGPWDIDASPSITLAHGLAANWNKVVSMDITIRKDDGTLIVRPAIDAHAFSITSTNVSVTLASGLGLGDFDATGTNRGHITFWIKKDVPTAAGFISVNAGANISKNVALAPTGTTVITNMAGFVESVGSAIDTQVWTIESQPVGSTATILPVDSLTAELQADMIGDYVLRLTATNDATPTPQTAYDEVTVTVAAAVNNPPTISTVTLSPQSYAAADPDYDLDYDPPLFPIDGFFKLAVSVLANDIDGDTLTYEVVEVDSFNPFTGDYGDPVVPQTLVFEQATPQSNAILIRGMMSDQTTSDHSRFYNFKVIVSDGNGGTAEKGFRIKIVPDNSVVDPVGTNITFASDTNVLSNIYQGFTRVTGFGLFDAESGMEYIQTITAYVTATGLPAGSLQAAAYFGNGANGGNPSGQQIVVPVGTLVNLIENGMMPPNVGFTFEGGVTLVMKTKLVLQSGIGVSSASVTIRVYNFNNVLIGIKTLQVTA